MSQGGGGAQRISIFLETVPGLSTLLALQRAEAEAFFKAKNVEFRGF